jgi:hypothetical protein
LVQCQIVHAISGLRDHVADMEVGGDFDRLDVPQLKRLTLPVLLAEPLTVRCLWLWPSLGQGKNKAFAPPAPIVGDVDDESLIVRSD